MGVITYDGSKFGFLKKSPDSNPLMAATRTRGCRKCGPRGDKVLQTGSSWPIFVVRSSGSTRGPQLRLSSKWRGNRPTATLTDLRTKMGIGAIFFSKGNRNAEGIDDHTSCEFSTNADFKTSKFIRDSTFRRTRQKERLMVSCRLGAVLSRSKSARNHFFLFRLYKCVYLLFCAAGCLISGDIWYKCR